MSKWFASGLMVISILLEPGLVVAGDAATEAQEGEINHWIEYYQKERGGWSGDEKPVQSEHEDSTSPAPNEAVSDATPGQADAED